MTPVLVTEKPPIRHRVLATPPGSKVAYRWSDDETAAESVLQNLTDEDAVPGGYKQAQGSLPRKPGVDYRDMKPGTHLEIFGAGQRKIGEYRLERAPQSSGDYLTMDPAAFGYQAHLADDESARGIPIARDLGSLRGPSTAREVAIRTAAYHPEGLQTIADIDTGAPAAKSTSTGPITRPLWEMLLDGGGVNIGRVRWRLTRIGIGTHTTDPSVFCDLYTDNTDAITTPSLVLSDFSAASTTDKTLSTPETYVLFYMGYSGSGAGSTGVEYGVQISELAYFDDSGIPIRGSWPDIGVLASDVIAYGVEQFAPLLNFTTGNEGTIRPSSFLIPHLPFKESGPVSNWITRANRFELREWGVWDDKTLWYNGRGQREGRKRWRARSGPTKFKETGQGMDRAVNGAIVEWQDVDGTTKVIGPPGSGYRLTDSRLLDVDPDNIANQQNGERHWKKIALRSVGTQTSAVRTGAIFLELMKQLDGSGTAEFQGYVEDDKGALWPYDAVHSGDLVDFVDLALSGDRYVIQCRRNHAELKAEIQLDAPPDQFEALLEQLDVVLVSVGFGG